MSFVVLLLSLVAVQISVHGLNQGSYDRDRTQAIDAAEAGIDSGVSTIQTSTPTALPCTNDGNLTTTPTAHYHVVFSYYPKYPISGSPMTCPIAAHSLPGAAMLISTGSAGTRPSAPNAHRQGRHQAAAQAQPGTAVHDQRCTSLYAK